MDRLRWLLFRLRGLVRRRHYTDALDEEVRFHLEEEAERLVETGVSPEEATAAARRSLGSPLAVRAHTRGRLDLSSLEQVCATSPTAGDNRQGKAAFRGGGPVACTRRRRLPHDVRGDGRVAVPPLPVRDAERLHVMFRESQGSDGPPRSFDGVEYPLFLRMRAAISAPPCSACRTPNEATSRTVAIRTSRKPRCSTSRVNSSRSSD